MFHFSQNIQMYRKCDIFFKNILLLFLSQLQEYLSPFLFFVLRIFNDEKEHIFKFFWKGTTKMASFLGPNFC